MNRLISRVPWLSEWTATLALLFVGAFALLVSHPTVAVAARPVGWSVGTALPADYPAGWDVSFAYFPPMDQVVLFGGGPRLESESWNNETWIYTGGEWRQGPSAPHALTARGGAAMAYHPGIGKVVLFGGAGGEWPMPNDTWLYDGVGWSPGPAAPAGLTGRTGARMVYHERLGKLVMHGGSGSAPYDETWLFDGIRWTRGPASPPAMGPREYFGMTYDPELEKVYVAGGNGLTDSWYFDGVSWTAGPSIDPVGPKERFTMAYDPQLGGPVLFGGLGPGSSTGETWLLRDGQWVELPTAPDKPSARLDAMVLWHPGEDALLVVGGIGNTDGGKVGLRDTRFFREVPPEVSSVTVTPEGAHESNPLKLTTGPVTGGYGKLVYTYEWLVNGVVVPGADEKTLQPGPYQHGDQVEARVLVTDGIGISGPWVSSPVMTIGNRPPSIRSASVSPTKAYVTSTLTVTVNDVKDPDGDAVSLLYEWKVNGAVKGAASELTPDHFTGDDSVTVTVTPVDSEGSAGEPVTSSAKVVQWNIDPSSDVGPGQNVGIRGGGYQPNERVDIKMDSPAGPIMETLQADPSGALLFDTVTLPAPMSGGQHLMYGVGRASGIEGYGPMTVIPTASLDPNRVAAGDSTAFSAMGFLPSERVSIKFPHGSPVLATADGSGSVTANLVSPAEPVDGGTVEASADSGTAGANFSVKSLIVLPATARPKDPVPVTMSGFGASETIEVSFDGGRVASTFSTDGTGSVTSTMVLDMLFGNNHEVSAHGRESGAEALTKIDLPAFVDIAPTAGPPGTTIAVTSGPGWVPGEVLDVKWGAQVIKQVTASQSGTINTTFQAPDHAPGAVTIKLAGSDLGLVPTATFTVT